MGRKYTDEQIQFIADNITGRSHKEMAAMFNLHFGTALPETTIMSLSFRNGLKNGIDSRLIMDGKTGTATRFQKGQRSWNKGKKGITLGGEQTQFKKGNLPHNHRPVGTERINTDGYVDVKIADPGKWRQKHLLIWEAANGPVPAGHVLIFADGDPLNVTLDNLLLITRAQLAVMNKRGLIATSKELTEAGVIVADIIRKVAERKRK